MLLADFGADVVKVERIDGGDDARAWGPPFLDSESLWFLSVNRNKRSIGLNYSSDQGYWVLSDLVAWADVVICNQTIRVQHKLKTDYQSLVEINPSLIHTSVTGFGVSGKRADWACYDLIAEGYSGVMDLTGAIDRGPQKIGAPAADMLAGQDASMSIMAALIDRSNTGRPHCIDVSLVESMTRFISCRIVPWLGGDRVPQRSGGTDSVIAVYQAFETADEPITLGLGSDAIWQRFWQAVEKPDYAKHDSMTDNTARRQLREKIVADIQAILILRPRTEWLSRFSKARVPAGPINRVDETASDSELIARGLFYTLEAEDGRRIPQVGLGIHLDGDAAVATHGPPRFGQHSQSILSDELHYSMDRIEKLLNAGTVSAGLRT